MTNPIFAKLSNKIHKNEQYIIIFSVQPTFLINIKPTGQKKKKKLKKQQKST